MNNFTIAITGASGAVYAFRLMEYLLEKRIEFNLVSTQNARGITLQELRDRLEKITDPDGMVKSESKLFKKLFPKAGGLITYYREDDLFSPIASGSAAPKQMIICPLSMGTLGRIASGISSNLIERAADVVLKEKKALILIPRETPLNAIHL